MKKRKKHFDSLNANNMMQVLVQIILIMDAVCMRQITAVST